MSGNLNISCSILKALSQSYYDSDIPSNAVASGALLQIAYMFLGNNNLAQVSAGLAVGTHPTSSYYNLRETFYELTSSFYTLSGNLNSSASNWNAFSGYPTLSSNLDSSGTRWNAISSSVSGILNSGTYTTIPTAIYLRSPDNTVWKITIENDGVLSSTVA